MANPVIYTIPVGQWVKVASNVTTGNILPTRKEARYVQTLRVTGDPAPTNGSYTDAKELSYDGAVVNSSGAIDVYVAVTGLKAGQIRSDL